jgi:hypothetical protein
MLRCQNGRIACHYPLDQNLIEARLHHASDQRQKGLELASVPFAYTLRARTAAANSSSTGTV